MTADHMFTSSQPNGNRAPVATSHNFGRLLTGQSHNTAAALAAVLISSACNVVSPLLIVSAIDAAIAHENFPLLMRHAAALAIVSLVSLATSYFQTLKMGLVGREIVFKLRNELFKALSQFPVSFFAKNKAGDLISRINSDTERVNQFFSDSLVQFLSSAFLIFGSIVLVLSINWRLGFVVLAPGFVILVVAWGASNWVRKSNRRNLETLGALTGELHEGLANFKALRAFNRSEYFRDKFEEANSIHYRVSINSGISSNIFLPLLTLAAGSAQLFVVIYGISLVRDGELSIGLLIGYLFYAAIIYNPLRQLATVWSSLQLCLASLDRINELLSLETGLTRIATSRAAWSDSLLAFDGVGFSYSPDKIILSNVNFQLERGKTYAFVGPTGGGKTTIAMLMSRLYDPTIGEIYLNGRDIRGYPPKERAEKIGFILQDPILFSGTLRDNIVYGSEWLTDLSEERLEAHLVSKGVAQLLYRFNDGLGTQIGSAGADLSLGEKQLIAFMRAVIREPELLILDEPTANVDTVTEQLLEQTLDRLPATSTKVIVAHRLNTIRKADGIFFVGGGNVRMASSMEQALNMLFGEKLAS
jgi:ATP-binding cassette subfamily B protein